jgi:multiple antibiotic resistance protein
MPKTTAFLTFVGALLAIMNPLSTAPVFLTWTEGQSVAERKRTALITTLAVLIILFVAAVLGRPLLAFFGIRVPSFQVGGGLITLMLGFSMLRARRDHMTRTPGEAAEAQDRDDVAIFPLAIPLFAGPASITIVIAHSRQMNGMTGLALMSAGIVGVTALLWVALRFAAPIAGYLSHTAMNVVTRLMGILLVAIATEMIVDGIGTLFPVLLSSGQ